MAYDVASPETRPATTRVVRYHLRAMEHCTCRIDAHCLGELKRLDFGLQSGVLTRLQVLRALHAMQRCPCYFATHCIETLCGLVADLSLTLRRERHERTRTKKARVGAPPEAPGAPMGPVGPRPPA